MGTWAVSSSAAHLVERVYRSIHFTHWYSFGLFFITGGAMVGFALARIMYLNVDGLFCKKGAVPGECYYFGADGDTRYRVGFIMHLSTILPAGLLVWLQFVPLIRHKAILFHRMNGYLVLCLSIVSIAGVFMIAEKAFGGDLYTQTMNGLVAVIFLGCIAMAYINVKRLRLDQHRAWMLRAWVYAGSIISLRLVLMAVTKVASIKGTFSTTMLCKKINFIFGNSSNITTMVYPACGAYFTKENQEQSAVVVANSNSNNPAEIAAVLDISFGVAFLIAFTIHAACVEIYLNLTSEEAQRLREVSEQRRLTKAAD